MAFGSFDRKNASQPMAEINMVPLIDVVLVLLVLFIVTAPLLTNAVKPGHDDFFGAVTPGVGLYLAYTYPLKPAPQNIKTRRTN